MTVNGKLGARAVKEEVDSDETPSSEANEECVCVYGRFGERGSMDRQVWPR